MSDTEGMIKLAIIALVIAGAVAVGSFVVVVVVPLFLLGCVVDYGMRQGYNKKLAAIQGSPELIKGPAIRDFEARIVEGEVLIAWLVDLPGDAALEIYRVEGPAGGSLDELGERAVCIHSTGVEFTHNRDMTLTDHDLSPGRYTYFPVVSGLTIQKEPLPYSFFDFANEVQFRTRKNRNRLRGESSIVEVLDPSVNQLLDQRDPATKMADDVLAHFRERKKFDADLDIAIARITDSSDLTEAEKQEAIELIETRSVSQ